MATRKSSHSAPEKGKNGNNLITVRERAAPRRMQYFRGIFNRKKADIGVAKTPKVLLDVNVQPTARRIQRQVCHQSLKEWKSRWNDGTDAKFLILFLFDTQNHREWLN